MLEWGTTNTLRPLWARMWLYGSAGSGKTVAAACMPSPFFAFVCNENSETTLRGGNYRFARIGVPPVGAPADHVVAVRSDTEQLMNALLAASAKGTLYQDFGQTFVFDSFSHYNDLVVSELADMTGEAGPRRRATKGMDQAKWGLLRAHYLHIRDVLWRLPMHIVFTSFDYVKTNAQFEVIDAGPAVQGTGGDLLPSSCDGLGYCEQEPGGRRVVWFRKSGPFPARHRYPGVSEGPIANHELWKSIGPALGHGS